MKKGGRIIRNTSLTKLMTLKSEIRDKTITRLMEARDSNTRYITMAT